MTLPDQEAVLFAFDEYSLPFRKNLFLTLQPAQKHPQNPILKRGGPGTPDEARAQFHGTVLHVNGKFRMWYVAIDEPSVQEFHKARGMAGLQSRVALAESSDGIHWRKPNLGLVEYRGNKANNLVDMEPGVLWPSILYEPGDPDPAKRYKMVFKATGGRLKGLLDRYSGFDYLVSPLCAYSPDGLHWRLAQHNPPLKGNMEGTNFYKFAGSYFMQGHIYSAWSPTTGLLLNGDPTGRVLFTYRSPDFVRWSEAPALSFARYGYRSAKGGTVEEAHTVTGAWVRGNVVVSAYLQWHGSNDVDSRWMDVGLMLSNDGIHFREPIPDFQLISRGEKDSWQGGSLWGVSFVNVGEKTHIYYSGLTGGGSTALARGDIGLATLDRDRLGYLSLKDSRETGYLMSCPVELGAKTRLVANIDGVGSDSSIRIGLKDERYQPIPGYSLEESQPLTVSGLQQPVSWKGREVITGLAGKRVLLEVQFQGAANRNPRLYALYLQPAP